MFGDHVWSGGTCKSWYLNGKGKITANWPSSTVRQVITTRTSPGLFEIFDCKWMDAVHGNAGGHRSACLRKGGSLHLHCARVAIAKKPKETAQLVVILVVLHGSC